VTVPLAAQLAIGIVIAASIAYLTTPVAVRAAQRFAFFDRPAGYKAHAAPTPYLGGAAVMGAFALALLLGSGQWSRTLPLLGGMITLCVVGTIDDRRTLSPGLRVVVELGLGAVLSLSGLGWHLHAGQLWDLAATAVWVVVVVNAFNLFDNMDGAASTMALVVAAGVAVLALTTGDHWAAVASAALCGACVGFLPYNLASPAKIFLGDGGSMPLGFAVAALVASVAEAAEPGHAAVVAGFLLVGIPALDTSLVVISRRRRGVSILTGGQDHLTHRARARFRSAGRVAFVLGAAQAVVSVLVIFATRQGSSAIVYGLLAFLVCAATAIAVLEAKPEEHATASASRPGRDRRNVGLASVAGLSLIGLGAGISPLFSAYYDAATWVPIGLGVVIVAAALTLARRPQLSSPQALALAGLAALGLWALLSATWGGSAERATADGNRLIVYAALFLLLIVLIERGLHARVLLGAVGAGIAIVAASVLIRMLGSEPASLFAGGRLNGPLGYINGEACLFAMGCWLSLALAEQRRAAVAGAGAAATVALACLALLSQSRGAAIATFATVIVTLALIPGFRRRALALVAVGSGVAAVGGTVIHVYTSGGATGPIHDAAVAILVAAAATAVAWGLLVAVHNRLVARGGEIAARARAGVTALIVLLVVAMAAAGVARHSAIEHTISTQWHAFVHLSEPSGKGLTGATQSRLFSGGGNRYDYWRVAFKAWRAHPIVGVGAGNYNETYYLLRRTQEAIDNPHSIALQLLSELGLVGAALFALVLSGIGLGLRGMRRAARSSLEARTMLLAATGVLTVWLVDTTGDWMHLLPGITAVAIAAAAVVVRVRADSAGRPRLGSQRQRPRLLMLAGAAGVAFALAVAGASLSRQGLTRVFVDRARADIASKPVAAMTEANRALRLDSANLEAYFAKAAALARLDAPDAARATLLQAAHRDPGYFVTWTLLGDLEVRLRNFPAARTFYQHASALDPRDDYLARLAVDPATALGPTGR
jgi:UDP-GlcNAc:undecaprenyl-phosphate GlcNAc-1-phosphate transferase